MSFDFENTPSQIFLGYRLVPSRSLTTGKVSVLRYAPNTHDPISEHPDMETAEQACRKDAMTLIWRHEHRDFKGKVGTSRAVLIYRNGTTLVPLTGLTDDELADKLPYALKKEAERKARKEAKSS